MKKKRDPIIMCPLGRIKCPKKNCRYWNEKKQDCEPRLKNPGKYAEKLIFEK